MSKSVRAKVVGIISDLHCGHDYGLMSERWQNTPHKNAPSRRAKAAKAQKELLAFYMKCLDMYPEPDVLIVNGDAIDGRGEASGGLELALADRDDQVECAADLIRAAKAKKVVMTYGTPYHVGKLERWERNIAEKVGAECIDDQIYPRVNGLVFDCKHHVGRSSVEHGKHTAPAKERVKNILESFEAMAPRGHAFIRSHVHYYTFCGGPDWVALTTPSLQGSTWFGKNRVGGVVHFGLTFFQVISAEEWKWDTLISRSPVLRSKVIDL